MSLLLYISHVLLSIKCQTISSVKIISYQSIFFNQMCQNVVCWVWKICSIVFAVLFLLNFQSMLLYVNLCELFLHFTVAILFLSETHYIFYCISCYCAMLVLISIGRFYILFLCRQGILITTQNLNILHEVFTQPDKWMNQYKKPYYGWNVSTVYFICCNDVIVASKVAIRHILSQH